MDRIEQARDLMKQGRAEAAKALLLRAVQGSPRDAAANNLLSAILARQGEHAQALFYAQRAAEIVPDAPPLLINLGSILGLNGRHAEAVAAFERAIAIAPSASEARVGLVRAYLQAKDFPAAVEAGRRAIRDGVSDPDLWALTASTLDQLGRTAEATAMLREGVVRNPGHPMLLSHLAFVMNYDGAASAADVATAHRLYGELLGKLLQPLPGEPPRARDPEKRLRVGFVTADLREHSVAYFAHAAIRGLKEAGCELACYFAAIKHDAVTRRLKPEFALWRDVNPLGPRELAQTIRADGVDVVLELSGHSEAHRLAALSLRAAPLQVTYLGYPNTTGVPAMDVRIVDSLTDPPGVEALATEKLVRIDPCFLCYRPVEAAPPVAVRPGDGPVVFGSFNAMPKMNGPTLALWGRVLAGVPGSRLLIKNQGVEASRQRVIEVLGRAGVDQGRVEFLSWAGTTAEHLGAYGRVDIALDTVTYNGTTTTCEALLMGVPVVTLAGKTHASRVGLSLLTNAGLPELVAGDEERFLAVAAALAGDRAALATLRAGLRARLLGSALCDARAFGARFAGAIRGLWRDRCAG